MKFVAHESSDVIPTHALLQPTCQEQMLRVYGAKAQLAPWHKEPPTSKPAASQEPAATQWHVQLTPMSKLHNIKP
jgi:hypothetical protein